MKFDKLAEHQVAKAKAEGKLENLAGEGKPLPDRQPGDFADQVSFRIMAEAGALPEEIRLMKEVQQQAQVLKATKDPALRKEEMRKLADLQQQLEMQKEARQSFFRSQKKI